MLTLRSAGTGTTDVGVALTDADGADDAGAINVGGETPAPTSSSRDTAGNPANPSAASGVLTEAGVAGGGSTCENAK